MTGWDQPQVKVTHGLLRFGSPDIWHSDIPPRAEGCKKKNIDANTAINKVRVNPMNSVVMSEGRLNLRTEISLRLSAAFRLPHCISGHAGVQERTGIHLYLSN